MLDDLGSTFGFDAGLFGALLGVALIVVIIAILGVFEADGTAQVFGVIAVAAVCVVIGLFPTWVIIVLAIIGGVLVFKAIVES